MTGDIGLTAAAIARRVGIGTGGLTVVNGAELDAMPENDLDTVLAGQPGIVFARSSPEAKLRIADALRHKGQVVAMTGADEIRRFLLRHLRARRPAPSPG